MIVPVAAIAAVSIGYAAYTPKHVDVVTGDSVRWSQDSVRRHTVTADDGSFDSGVLLGGDSYQRVFTAPGHYGYYCRLHAGIIGDVAVHDVLIDKPGTAASKDRAYPLTGRAAGGTKTVTITGDDGSSTTASVGADGTFSASVTPARTTTYTAGDSPPVTLLVLDRTIAARRLSTQAVRARVAPASRGGTVVLQLWLRERFGWWPVDRARLGRSSSATLRTGHRRRALARVVYTLPDGATPLAVSRTFHLGRG